jgi:hypothetical protein
MEDRTACLSRTVPIAMTGAAQLRADGIYSCCYAVNVHNHPWWGTSRKEGMAWYSSKPMPVGDHILQKFNTLYLTRFRTYKIARTTQTRGGGLRQIKTCHLSPLQINLFRWRHFALLSISLIFIRPIASSKVLTLEKVDLRGFQFIIIKYYTMHSKQLFRDLKSNR